MHAIAENLNVMNVKILSYGCKERLICIEWFQFCLNVDFV